MFLSNTSQYQRALKRFIYGALKTLVLITALWVFVQLIFYLYPLAFRMASNADSLVMLDFARDLLLGHSISHWNLPRVPYLFPDTVIALGVMVFGWFNTTSFYLIAMINYAIIIGIATITLRQAKGLENLTIWNTAWLLSLSLLTIGLVLPSSFTTLYWQVFASGAHFLSAAVVLAMMQLSTYWQTRSEQRCWVALLLLLAIAEGVSNSMAALLLLIWCGAQWFERLYTHRRLRADLIAVFFGALIGTALSTLIPRQSLVDSFFAIDKFISAIHAFMLWLIGDPAHFGLVILLLVLLFLYPYLLIAGSKEYSQGLRTFFCSPVLFPSLGVMAATPLFFQEPGSVRYMAFPALITLVSLSLLYIRLWQRAGRHRWRLMISMVAAFMVIASWQLQHARIGPVIPKLSGKDLGGLATGAQTDLAIACLEKAKSQLTLGDGLATYWNARPTRFASQFEHYFAQINPWRPRSGYMVWGNNAIDFVYRESSTKTPRQYNFVLATHDELSNRLWGSLPSQAAVITECPAHQILYFDDPSILWNFLFPLRVPFGFENEHPDQDASPIPRLQTRIFPADDFFSEVGKRSGASLVATGQAGVLAYGPYIPLLPGQYRLIARGQLHQAHAGNGLIDVCTQFGKKVIASKTFALTGSQTIKTAPISESVIAYLDFTLTTTTNDMEFRLSIPQGTHGTLIQFELQRLQ